MAGQSLVGAWVQLYNILNDTYQSLQILPDIWLQLCYIKSLKLCLIWYKINIYWLPVIENVSTYILANFQLDQKANSYIYKRIFKSISPNAQVLQVIF